MLHKIVYMQKAFNSHEIEKIILFLFVIFKFTCK